MKTTIDKAIQLLKNQGECDKHCENCPAVFIYTMERIKECKCPIERMFIAERWIRDQVDDLIEKNIKTKLGPEYIEYGEKGS